MHRVGAQQRKLVVAARRGLRELARIPHSIEESEVDETIGTPPLFFVCTASLCRQYSCLAAELWQAWLTISPLCAVSHLLWGDLSSTNDSRFA